MKKIISSVLAIMILSVMSASAVITFTDDFQRSTTGPQYTNTVPNVIGPYTVASGAWNISDASSAGRIPNFVTASSASASSIMYLDSMETLRDSDRSFTISADIWDGGYGEANRLGLVFNFQDENNYYAFDYSVTSAGNGTARLLKYAGGVETVLDQATGLNMDQYTYYTMVIEGNADSIAATLKTADETVLYTTTNSSTTYVDGTAGFWRNSAASVAFDNFSVELVGQDPDVAVTDDFQRSTTGPQTSTSDPNAIGPYTVITGEWNISNASSAGRIPNFVTASSTYPNSIMLANSLETLRGAGYSFTLSTDVWNGGNGSLYRQGIVFNFQDANNYYAFDYCVPANGNGTARLLKYAGGVETELDIATGLNLSVYTYYTMIIEGDADSITATLRLAGGGYICSLSDSSTTYMDGTAGFWRNSTASVAFDNFSLELTVPPTPPTMSYAVSNGVITITAGNLSPSSSALQATTNLVSGTWSNLYSVAGVTETNWTLPMNEHQEFFRIQATH